MRPHQAKRTQAPQSQAINQVAVRQGAACVSSRNAANATPRFPRANPVRNQLTAVQTSTAMARSIVCASRQRLGRPGLRYAAQSGTSESNVARPLAKVQLIASARCVRPPAQKHGCDAQNPIATGRYVAIISRAEVTQSGSENALRLSVT